MQKTLDSFFHKVQTVEETIPREWKENPLPRSPATPKRPVGRPKKRNFEEVEEAILIREVEQTKDVSQMPKRGKYAMYSKSQKEEILEEAELCGLRATSRKWKIAPSTIATWKKEVNVDVNRSKTGRKIGSGRRLTYSDSAEEQIVGWIIQQRENQISVS